MSKPIQIVVGGDGQYDPAPGDTEVNHPLIKGDFYLSSAGFGPLPYADYEPLPAGGFRLLNYQFSEGEVYFATIVALAGDTASFSNYTNGFNYSRVLSAMMGRIGFRQGTISEYAIVNSDNAQSLSGRYYDDFHSLVTVKNIKDTTENYQLGTIEFNAYLQSLKKSVIMRCLNGVLNVPEQIERVLSFNRLGYNDQPIENEDLFKGFEIKVAKDDSIGVQIQSATLLFDSDVTITLYLFKDGKKSSIWSQEVEVIASEATVINFDSVVLNYLSQGTKGGRFYFGYFQSELGSAKAIKEQAECWNATKCFSARPMQAEETETGQFDRENITWSYEANGINLEISSFKDHTNTVVRQAALFDELVGLQMAYNVVEQIVYSTRSNGTERALKDNVDRMGVQLDLNGAAPISEGPKTTGLKQRIERELKRVKEGFYPKPKSMTVSLCP
jgi:hypothetical protein